MAESAGCKNQAFLLGRAVGLQFHLESSQDSIDHLISNCADELTEGDYVQGPEELLAHLDRLPEMAELLECFLDNMERVFGSEA